MRMQRCNERNIELSNSTLERADETVNPATDRAARNYREEFRMRMHKIRENGVAPRRGEGKNTQNQIGFGWFWNYSAFARDAFDM